MANLTNNSEKRNLSDMAEHMDEQIAKMRAMIPSAGNFECIEMPYSGTEWDRMVALFDTGGETFEEVEAGTVKDLYDFLHNEGWTHSGDDPIGLDMDGNIQYSPCRVMSFEEFYDHHFYNVEREMIIRYLEEERGII